jgi:hypothetical protein
LRVRVRAPSALPPRTIVFVYTDRDGTAPAMVPILPNGTAEVDVQRSGPIDVVLAVTPGGASIVQFARRDGVPANEAEVVFELGANELPNGSLRGRLVDELGAPRSAMSLHVNRLAADGLVVLVQGMTDAEGAFAIGPLPAGDYQVSTGALSQLRPVGKATLLGAGDEHLGDLVVKRR